MMMKKTGINLPKYLEGLDLENLKPENGGMIKRLRKGPANKLQFTDLYLAQINFQEILLNNNLYDAKDIKLPDDNLDLFKYHTLQLMSEIGELLSADKRWKNYRNTKLDKENKIEEIADCFIVLLNIAIFSGLYPSELVIAIKNKIEENYARVLAKIEEDRK